MAAMFETWLQNPWTVGLATNVITTGILTGSAKLWNKYHRKTPTQRPSVTPSISPEELFSTRAGSTIVQHYSIYETLMPLNLVVTEDTSTLRAQRSPPTQGSKIEPKSAGWIAGS
jgi:hypothetical protein